MKKKLIFSMLCIVVSTCGFSQYGIKELPLNKEFRLVRLNYENKSGEIAFSVFEYNNQGYLTAARWQLNDSSRSGVISYKYDSVGNLSEKYRIFSDGISILQNFQYTPDGKLKIDNFERSDRTVGKAEFFYDENGKLISADCNKQNGWFSGKLQYEYSNEGKLAKANIFQNNEVIGTITYSLNSSGLIEKEYWDFPDNWNQTFIYIYLHVNEL